MARERDARDAAERAARRRKLAEVFGEVLPETTEDDVPARGESSSAVSEHERWYLENRPPHHDKGSV